MLNSYCLRNNQYYVCKSEESFSVNIKRINEFNFQKKIVATYYYFNSNIVELKKTIDKKNLVKLNNIAYYLQKVNANKEAIFLLEKILKKYYSLLLRTLIY